MGTVSYNFYLKICLSVCLSLDQFQSNFFCPESYIPFSDGFRLLRCKKKTINIILRGLFEVIFSCYWDNGQAILNLFSGHFEVNLE